MEYWNDNKLVVVDRLGDYYIPQRQVVCLIAEEGYCKVHYTDDGRQSNSILGSRSVEYYLQQMKGNMLRIRRGTCVNPNFVKELTRTRIMRLTFECDAIPMLIVARDKYTQVRDQLRHQQFSR